MMASSTIRQGVVGSTALSFTKSAVLETADLAGGVTGLNQTGGNDQSADDTVQNGNAQLLRHALVHAGETGAAQHDNLSQILFQSDLSCVQVGTLNSGIIKVTLGATHAGAGAVQMILVDNSLLVGDGVVAGADHGEGVAQHSSQMHGSLADTDDGLGGDLLEQIQVGIAVASNDEGIILSLVLANDLHHTVGANGLIGYIGASSYRRLASVVGDPVIDSEGNTKLDIPSQYKGKPGWMVDASIGKSINLRGGQRLNINLQLQNVLNNENMITGGYEQNRDDNYSDGEARTYKFSKNPYLYYANAFNFYLNIGLRF